MNILILAEALTLCLIVAGLFGRPDLSASGGVLLLIEIYLHSKEGAKP